MQYFDFFAAIQQAMIEQCYITQTLFFNITQTFPYKTLCGNETFGSNLPCSLTYGWKSLYSPTYTKYCEYNG